MEVTGTGQVISAELEGLELTARSRYEDLKASGRRFAEDMWRLGETLNEAKAALKHGEWSRWLDKIGINESTAYKCRKIHERCPQIEEVFGRTRRELLGEGKSVPGTDLTDDPDDPFAAPEVKTEKEIIDELDQRINELEAQKERLEKMIEDDERPELMERLTVLRNLETRQQTLRAMIHNLWHRGDEYKRTSEAKALYKELWP